MNLYRITRQMEISPMRCKTWFLSLSQIWSYSTLSSSLSSLQKFYQINWIPWRFNPGMSDLLTLYSHIWLTLYKCHSFSLEDPLSFISWLPWHLSDLSKNHFHKAAIPDSDRAQVSLLCGHMAFYAFPSRLVSQLWCNILLWNLPLSVFLLKFKS